MSAGTRQVRVRHPNRTTWALDTLIGESVTVFFESAKRTYETRKASAR